MSATFVPSHWPLAPRPARAFGRRLAAAGSAGTLDAVQWLLQRNCSITPQQLGGVYASLCALSAVIAGFFFWQGAPYVAVFAGLELAAVGLAMLVFARHAGDKETLTLVGRSLLVELCSGNRIERTDMAADWLRVEPSAGQGSLIQLSERGRTVRVGRYLRPELRGAFAQELRLALRQPSARPQPENDSN